jgi:hypothetical protein
MSPVIHDDNAPYYQRYKVLLENYPSLPQNMGKRWTEEEKDELERELRAGTSTQIIATAHARTQRAIRMAIANLAGEKICLGVPIEEVMELTDLSDTEVHKAHQRYLKQQENLRLWKVKNTEIEEEKPWDWNTLCGTPCDLHTEAMTEEKDAAINQFISALPHELCDVYGCDAAEQGDGDEDDRDYEYGDSIYGSDDEKPEGDSANNELIDIREFLEFIQFRDLDVEYTNDYENKESDAPPMTSLEVPRNSLGPVDGINVIRSERGYYVSFRIPPK